jgi:aryl-alcohol dehydrogenase-like predicted oxidoreductase
MKTRKIGSLTVSLAGLGCNNFGWRIDAQATAAVVNATIDAGINFFDTADIYGKGQSEEYLGRALGHRRQGMIVATKFGMKMDEDNPAGNRLHRPLPNPSAGPSSAHRRYTGRAG